MKVKRNIDEFITAVKTDALKVGDKLITEDIAGKAIFEVAEIRKKKIYMVRKYCLPKDYDKTHTELDDFLNNEYLDTLPEELKDIMKKRKGSRIFVPWFNEVFGKLEGCDWADQSRGKQWKIFRTTKGKIRLDTDKYGYSRWYWLASPHIGTSTYFCIVSAAGAPYTDSASYSIGVLPCFKVNRGAIA